MVFCSSCGKEIKDENQKFCEHCGSSLKPQIIASKTSKSQTMSNQDLPHHKPGGLFDLNRDYYILKEQYWDWGSGDILNKENKVIGRMHRKIFNIRKKVELQEVDGSVSATIHSKIITARGAQDLKDPDGNLIARIKKKILSFFRPKFFLESPDGERWYEAQGKFMGWSFQIKDLSSGEIIAEIEKADRWRDVFLGGLLDYKDTYALKILDNVTDRRILLGFVLSIDNVLHDIK
ncbi:MAG: zinc-ribbon domain-containing protein [Candidatus Lokiarchaeota archaeon]|nr:zinc-ribbon domain-containing protein [Candidatus Lokiarchaeota archaeon]MBD3198371.1 zinc-ribbon domain-containing protein [Candidatus Lokiarchaeota archaeon]